MGRDRGRNFSIKCEINCKRKARRFFNVRTKHIPAKNLSALITAPPLPNHSILSICGELIDIAVTI